MVDQPENWKQTLYKVLDDSEIKQTIVIIEDDAAAFRVVQFFELKRFRTTKASSALAPRAAYCRDSVWQSREVAIVEAQRLVAKHLLDHWRICCDEDSSREAS